MITDLNVIVKEWAYRVHDGKPDPNKSAHLYHLTEILIENKWSLGVIDELIQNLNEIAPTAMVANPNPKGIVDKVQYRYARKWLEDNPEADVSDEYEDEVGDEDGEEKPKGPPVKSFGSKTKENHEKYIGKAKEVLENEQNPDIKGAMTVLTDNWEKFINAETEEERIEAVESLIDNSLIERNQWSEKSKGKIYISSNAAGIPYKHFMGGGQGDAVTEEMNKIIRANGLEVNMRNNSADRALADLSGKHNEAGVVALLDPSEENQKAYDESRQKYKELSNDDSEPH